MVYSLHGPVLINAWMLLGIPVGFDGPVYLP